MSIRKIKDAKDLSINELIYFKGHAKAMLQQQLDIIKQCNPSMEEINKYMNDWLKFTRRILL